MKNRILSLLLAIVMVFSCAPFAAANGFATEGVPAISADGPLSLPVGSGQSVMDVQAPVGGAEVTGTAQRPVVTDTGLTKFEAQETDRFSETEAAVRYEADDTVTFIVVMEDKPLLELFSVEDIAGQTASVANYEKKQNNSLTAVRQQMEQRFGKEAGFEIGFEYTIATTGLSVTTAYGNKDAIAEMKGVKAVYVAPMFQLPEDGMERSDAEPMTNNASTMIGGDVMNLAGYTGKGMRIAILDTGILVDHPSFQPLPEDVLVDPMTRESVEDIWSTLNASQMTTMLNQTYKNTKIPYAFNYVSGGFDVANTFAGSDHGTHVAGISAGNKTEQSVGVAPDAQLIVMQVFQQGGGASWSTIMAALEDCVRLEVDVANLSLGAAAGYTDPDDSMLETMNLFLETDIQLVIASGNDTNNAYMNLWGGDMSLLENPDIGLTGTPGTYSAALSVASAQNDGEQMLYFTVDGTDIGYNDSAATTDTMLIYNYMGQTLEYVVVPGVGAESDYEGLDVAGKVALVSRGTTSFPEKQATAQAQGAVACVVYNNVSGMIYMQINDGEGNIPCVSITKDFGQYMIEAAGEDGVGSLTVCNADTKLFKQDREMSSFSSWGVTPDLKLKPEITGVGGNIYSATDPAISGTQYGYMSGTSMATPQIAGAMAVLIQYLDEEYPELTGAEQRRVAANLLMSTAEPLLADGELEYSPRYQGSGLANLVAATTTPVYFSNQDASETRPKVELGDDPDKTGVYEFEFEVTNLDKEDTVTYVIESSILTESIVAGYFIGNTPYALEATVETEGVLVDAVSYLKYDFNDDGKLSTADARALLRHINGVETVTNRHADYVDVNADGTVDKADVQVMTDYFAELEVDVDLLAEVSEDGSFETVDGFEVAPGETKTIKATITLTANDKAYLDQFPNGIYVEGYLYAVPYGGEGNGPKLTLPIMGFYGDWSDAEIFDEAEEELASLYPTYIFTYYSQLGTNPYFRAGKAGNEYNAFSYGNPLAEIDFGQLRNARDLNLKVTNAETGEEYYNETYNYSTKTYYNTSYGMIIPTYLMVEYGEVWDGMDANGDYLPNNTKVTYEVSGWLDDGDDVMDDSWSFDVTLDTEFPVIHNEHDLQNSLTTDENGVTWLELTLSDNQYIAAVFFMSPEGIIMGKYEVEQHKGETVTQKFNVTGFGTEFSVIVADYACNETEIDVELQPGDHNLNDSTLTVLDSNRIYGCETYDSAQIEGGWFSANKADFSDPRNETFDSTNRYYSAEFVNGYIVAQSAATGSLELITPSGSYWGTRTLLENNGRIGDSGVWVLYDMALDHSGTLAAAYEVNYETDATDSLLAVGWYYQGDQNNDGHDDGYNALFNIKFTNYGAITVQPVAGFSGVEDGMEILTLGITTDGKPYGISTDGKLYSIGTSKVWDGSIGEWGDWAIPCTKIGTTDFVNYPRYGGVNVIQSMGYDHNDGVMYWYAHSQVPNGVYYDNINTTYKVDLETAECTEIGNYGPGGQTGLFVPNELESDLFELGVQATNLQIVPSESTMVEGQTKRLDIQWTPWNAAEAEVTWGTSDDTLATVDEYGYVTAIRQGEVIITATATVMLDGYWEVVDGNWIWKDPAMGEKTVECRIKIVPSEDALYSYVITDFKEYVTEPVWVTYSDKSTTDTTEIGTQEITVTNPMTGEEVTDTAMWYGGTYYNGYVYTTAAASVDDGTGAIGTATALYKSKVTRGATPAETTIGEPELVGYAMNKVITAMGFDYNTGRMYCVENQFVGGLGIIDLETGAVDMLGHPNGDLSGAVYIVGLCVMADGTIVISDAVGSLYTMDPDTLTTQRIHYGSGDPYSAYYEAMTYDYNTGNIYWNPAESAGTSPLNLVVVENDPWDPSRKNATVMKLGGVNTKYGVQQTVMFTIPDNEPETKLIPVEAIEITNGEQVGGLQGGTLQLNTVTTPARPTIQKKTWSSSDENVVTVDDKGLLSYVGVGTATVTVSITNKDEATYGGPFTDSVEVTVRQAAGEFVAFLNADEGGTGYYDFWLKGNDYDLRNTAVGESMIAIYSLRTGTYYDGYFYAVNDKDQFMRIDANDVANYKILGTVSEQLAAMAVDYTTGTMYALTLPLFYDYNNWTALSVPGKLVSVDLDTGVLTEVAELDVSTPVFALACDAEGTLYAAGGSSDNYSSSSILYTLDKESGALTELLTLNNAGLYCDTIYYGTAQYRPQMTYDFGTDRLYLYATSDHVYSYTSYGMHMIQLGETPAASYLDGISLNTRSGAETKYGDVYLGLLAFIPEEDEVPTGTVNGIILNKSVGRIPVDGSVQLTAKVRPSNAADNTVTWISSDDSVVKVDENGLVTGISAGTATITVTSNENSAVTATCEITVVSLEGKQPTAYTVTNGAVYQFNPNLPALTAEIVADASAAVGAVKGIAVGDGCLYILTYSDYNNYLWKFDMLTGLISSMGQLYTFSEATGLAYDEVNRMIYVTAGFYVFQFQLDALKPNEFNYYSNYVMDSDYCTLTGVACVDGAVYTIGNDYYTSAPKLMKYSDKYLSDRTVLLEGYNVALVAGATDFAYNEADGLFYMTDASNTIYTVDLSGNVETIDMLGDGMVINGLTIVLPQ